MELEEEKEMDHFIKIVIHATPASEASFSTSSSLLLLLFIFFLSILFYVSCKNQFFQQRTIGAQRHASEHSELCYMVSSSHAHAVSRFPFIAGPDALFNFHIFPNIYMVFFTLQISIVVRVWIELAKSIYISGLML